MKIILVALISLFIVASAKADDKAVQKYRNYTPQQVKDMPDKLRSSELPVMYIRAARSGLAVDSELYFGMQLNQLMYSGIHDYQSAVRAFQTDLGDSPTGVLTVWQIHQLDYRSDLQKLSRIFFPDSYFSGKASDYAYVKGTLTILDDRIAWPINRHEIDCLKSENSCEVRQVMLDLPDLKKQWGQQYQVMIDNTEYYGITRWTDDTIDAESTSKPDSCRTTTLSLNFKTKEFFFITKNAGGKCEIFGTGTQLEKLPKPRIAQVIDGKEIFNEEFAKIEKAAYDVLASDFRKKADRPAAQI